MKFIFSVLTALAASSATAVTTPKIVERDALFSTAGTWQIHRGDPGVHGGCYALTSYQPDILLLVGFDLAQELVFLHVRSPRLQTDDVTNAYDIQIPFDSQKPWDTPVT